MDRKIWIFDIEQYKNLHLSVWYNIDTKEFKVFYIHELKNNVVEYFKFLKSGIKGVGYNCLNYDYPMIHHMIYSYDGAVDIVRKGKGEFSVKTINLINKSLYNKSQALIKTEFPKKNRIYRNLYFPVIDLFAIHHFDNKAKRQSLKGLQFEMGSKVVMETPIHFDTLIKTESDIDLVEQYCKSDVISTYDFAIISTDKIRLRQELQNQYPDFNCINLSDSSLGEQLMLYLYCKKTGRDKKEVKELKTVYTKIEFKDIIFSYIKFNKPVYQEILKEFQNKIYIGQKDFSVSKVIDKVEFNYGLGGIHASDKGIFKSDDTHILVDSDVASYYPNIPIQNGLFIKHLGIDFLTVYKEMVDTRVNAKRKSKDKSLSEEERKKYATIADGFKLAANSVYGKSAEETSFLFDFSYTLTTTINGQLSLTMLIEMLETSLSDFKLIQANTDGITYKIKKSELQLAESICNDWQSITKLELEHNYYLSMFIRDCNNYIALDKDFKAKFKGDYEVDKSIGSEKVYYKDSSFRIIRIAVSKYLLEGVPIKETILNHTEIRDFLGRIKFTSENYGILRTIDYTPDKPFGKIVDVRTEKVTRYYVSKKGNKFIKITKGSNAETSIQKGYKVRIMQMIPDVYENNIPDDIDYSFYLRESVKLINDIQSNGITSWLF
jgi:hypothetical protein